MRSQHIPSYYFLTTDVRDPATVENGLYWWTDLFTIDECLDWAEQGDPAYSSDYGIFIGPQDLNVGGFFALNESKSMEFFSKG